ncbi:MAG TPA: PAS domain S-box protein [Planctomycetaceae bacterium]|jgi:PAS domain S-box-containing protein
MTSSDDEESRVPSVAVQNAESILLAGRRAEEDLVRAKEILQRQSELLQLTLSSIGDAVVTTDVEGKVQTLNRVAELLTGWSQQDAQGRPLAEVFRIVNEDSRQPVDNPAERVLREGCVAGLANHTILIARDGTETPIDDSAAPIRDAQGRVYGVVLIFRDILERKRSDEALRRSERELSEFFENATVGLHWVGPDGTILRVNRAELDLLGYSREEYLGRHISEFHADKDVIDEMLRRLLAGEDLRNHPARMRCKDGSIKHVLINSNVLWEDGVFVHSRCITRDVTERMQVAESQARLAAIVESSDDAIISKTLEGRILSWNAGAQRLFDYTPQEAIGQSIFLIIPADRRDEERLILERLRRGERIEHYETVRVSKQGRPIDISLTISPIRDGAGRVVGASKIARDITTRMRAEKTARFLAQASAALAELTDYESTLQKVASLAVPLFADWCAVDMLESDGSLHRLTVTHGNLEKVRFVEDLDRRYPTRLSDAGGAGKVMRTGEPEWAAVIPDDRLEELARNDERFRLLRELALKSYVCVPLKSRGKVLGALTFAMAESGRSYEADDLQTAQDVAHRIVIAIENARLLGALRESDRRKDEFLAMLAHELRNPLAPIRNAVQIFRVKGPPAPELAWATDVIGRQVDQMTRLVDDLLDVSRINTGKIEIRKQRVTLASIIETAVEAVRPLIDSRGHELLVDLPTEPVVLDVDPTRLSQVFANLLNNSAKYTEPGGRISLTGRRRGDEIVVQVKDNGIGIPREMLPRIFGMFTQVDRSLDRAQGGLGIGLTLVQRLVQLHGGQVEAGSEGPGRGSEFVVRLPATREQTIKPGDAPLAKNVSATSKRRILIVDDNHDSAKSLAMLLRLMGNEVHTAYDGLEAVSTALSTQPDLMLLDIGLPKLDGYEVARRIRADLGNSIVLVALTGWGQEEDRRRSKEAGFDQHLTKPVEMNALQSLLTAPQFQHSTWTP